MGDVESRPNSRASQERALLPTIGQFTRALCVPLVVVAVCTLAACEDDGGNGSNGGDGGGGSRLRLFRIAFKMVTGSHKTVFMAMLIAWQALNKIDREE